MTDEPTVVEIDGEHLADLLRELEDATSVRVMIQDGGVKISANRGVWSLPLGRVPAW